MTFNPRPWEMAIMDRVERMLRDRLGDDLIMRRGVNRQLVLSLGLKLLKSRIDSGDYSFVDLLFGGESVSAVSGTSTPE